MQHFINAFKLYGVFSGRSTREEYWTFTLIYLMAYLTLSIIAYFINSEMFSFLLGILSLAVIIPSISITTRRLHDVGRSGWWQLSPLIGYLFAFIGVAQESTLLASAGGALALLLFVLLLYFLLQPSDDDNPYGPKPQ